MQTQMNLRGWFYMEVVENGEIVYSCGRDNLIVAVGRESACHLLAGAGTGKEVTQIGFGTGTAPVTDADTGITAGYLKPFDAVTYPVANQVKFDWALETGENNGVDVTEYGLFSTDGTLFAKVLQPPIAKTSSVRIQGYWIITS